MLFFIKPSTITLDAFINHNGIYQYFPIKRASEFFPDWFKNAKSFYNTRIEEFDLQYPTIKKCQGIISLYSSGFIIPNWGDFNILVKETGEYHSYTETDTVFFIEHCREQFTENFKDFVHLKLNSPWILKEKQGIKFHFTNPIWNNINKLSDFVIPDGIIDYKYQNSTNINFLLFKKNNEIKVKAGNPLAHIIPLTEKKVNLKLHLVSNDEYDKLRQASYLFSVVNRYKKVKKIQENKCPFGFS